MTAKKKPRTDNNAEQWEWARQVLREGAPYKEVAEELGCAVSTVYHHVGRKRWATPVNVKGAIRDILRCPIPGNGGYYVPEDESELSVAIRKTAVQHNLRIVPVSLEEFEQKLKESSDRRSGNNAKVKKPKRKMPSGLGGDEGDINGGEEGEESTGEDEDGDPELGVLAIDMSGDKLVQEAETIEPVANGETDDGERSKNTKDEEGSRVSGSRSPGLDDRPVITNSHPHGGKNEVILDGEFQLLPAHVRRFHKRVEAITERLLAEAEMLPPEIRSIADLKQVVALKRELYGLEDSTAQANKPLININILSDPESVSRPVVTPSEKPVKGETVGETE